MSEESNPPKEEAPRSRLDHWGKGKSPRQDFDRIMFDMRHPPRDPDAPIELSEFGRKSKNQQ